ncbi:expressed unknown protein [Seminavis robusta]|uniref:EGF-like domain-containing protein n=1 Tax=Seminavis robusta TaxID=568900 RepID=A0A9N8HAJ4_9STRA|nr:expressed unknown protein [Seminavis robusta]|eukprot:Sro322_g117010.1 n/a (527) ;mRNA; f:29777-31357
MVHRGFFVVLGLLLQVLVFISSSAATDETCGNSEGECSVSKDELESLQGLNALPARIAVISGQVPDLKMCGMWCREDAIKDDPSTPCRMDAGIMPCEGDFYCTTTCKLWDHLILSDPRNGFDTTTQTSGPVFSCPMFKRFDGFVTLKTAEVCDTSCLLPEIRPNRYPAPTGLGLMCDKGTCFPAISSREASHVKLECPCNWFGSDCDNDWIPIQSVQHTGIYGGTTSTADSSALTATTITVSKDDWPAIMAQHQPGGVIRIVQRDDNGRVQEQPYAVAAASADKGTIEILTAPPDTTLDPVPRAVAERIRAMRTLNNPPDNLYINPSIAGFFNSQWQFLMSVLQQQQNNIEHVILISTGAGLSGSLSVLEHILPAGESLIRSVHLYHGVRTLAELPHQRILHKLATQHSQFEMTLVESKPTTGVQAHVDNTPLEIQQAVVRGSRGRFRLLENATLPQKVYVQHVLESDWTNGNLPGVSLETAVFVTCGRLALLEDSKNMLQGIFCTGEADNYDCHTKVGQHFFTNI